MNDDKTEQSIREDPDMEDAELKRYYLEAKVSRIEEDNENLKQENQRLREEKQVLSNENSNLMKEKNLLSSERQQLKEQITVLEKREDPEARKRMDFLHSKLVSLIDQSVSLQKEGLAECIPRAVGETGDMAVNAWKQNMIQDMESRWSQVNSQGSWHFFGAVLRLCVFVHYLFLRMGKLYARGIIKASASISGKKMEEERRKLEQNKRRVEHNLSAMRETTEKHLSAAKAAAEAEIAAMKEMAEREMSAARGDAEQEIAILRDKTKRELSDERNAAEQEIAAEREKSEKALAAKKDADQRELDEKTAKLKGWKQRRQKELDDQEAALEKRKAELESKLRALTYWRAIAIILILGVVGVFLMVGA